MNMKHFLASTVAVAAMSLTALMPSDALGQSDRRQQTKNEWRNIAIGSALLGVYGLSKGNDTLTLVGIGGALYSLDRYEKDRKSQNSTWRKRSELYGNKTVWIDGKKYVRKTVTSKGKKYYKFVRA